MKEHHTKNKGDLGVLKAQCDLFEKGFLVLLPLSEHESFDLVGYKDNKFYKFQVKYRSIKNDTISIAMKTTWTDKNGYHKSIYDENSFDYLCVYCPETDKCYYVKYKDFLDSKKSIMLRFGETKNNQERGVLKAENFLSL